jgi:hypothetical protein
MKIDSRPYHSAMFAILLVALSASFAAAQFYGDPPDDTHPWAVHDMNRPQPQQVTPGKTPGAPPSDAIVLFDGTAASFKANWEHEKKNRKADWQFRDHPFQGAVCRLPAACRVGSTLQGAGQQSGAGKQRNFPGGSN